MTAIEFKGFSGIDNRTPAHQMSAGSLADCVNLDVRPGGDLATRPGSRRIGEGGHSPFVADSARWMLLRRGGDLIRREAGGDEQTIRSGFSAGRRAAYVRSPAGVIVWDGAQGCEVRDDGDVLDWPVVPPAVLAVHAVAAGSLPAGDYRVCALLRRRCDGAESVATRVLPVRLDAPGGIELQVAAFAAEYELVAFCSYAGGEQLFEAASGDGEFLWIGGPASVFGRAADSLDDLPPPLCAETPLMAIHRGCLTVADGQFLHYSRPWQWGAFDPLRRVVPFEISITGVASLAAGALVATRRALWLLLGDDLDSASLRRIADFGAPRQVLSRFDLALLARDGAGQGVLVVSEQGLLAVSDDGSLLPVGGDRWWPPDAAACSLALGMTHGALTARFFLS